MTPKMLKIMVAGAIGALLIDYYLKPTINKSVGL